MATVTTITGAQFDAMPYEEGRRWELVNGKLISVSSPTPRHQDIVFEILLAVRRYLQQNPGSMGLAYQDVEFALTGFLYLVPPTSPLK
jgi:Uma2 family endonuclease